MITTQKTKRISSVNTVEAKNRLNELIVQAVQTHRPIVVEKRGRPVVVVLDYESYQRDLAVRKKKTDASFWQELTAFHEHLRQKYPQGTGDSTALLRELREERGRR